MKSNPIPEKIVDFIYRHHVVSIACHSSSDFWAASCFYAFEHSTERLIILTDKNTRHGKLMLNTPIVSGTIAAQPLDVRDIEGVQFRAEATLLTGEQHMVALQRYLSKHPIAQGKVSDVWALSLIELKHTENRIAFAQKCEWKKKTADDTAV